MSRSRRNRDFKNLKTHIQQPLNPVKMDDDLGKVLDDLNAWGFLEDRQQDSPRAISCFGPGVFRGYLPVTWAGVVMWHKPRGYYFYDTLGMIGIWVLRTESGIDVVVGRRQLTYNPPFFNAESYYRLIQTEFRTFYKDSGGPPPEDARTYSVRYDPAHRLDIRREIEAELQRWATEHNTPRPGW
jgi:hypothetical protein